MERSFSSDKLYSYFQIILATFLGGPLAGGFLFAWNFRQLDKLEKAKMSLIAGASVYLFILILLAVLIKSGSRGFPLFALPLIYTAAAFWMAGDLFPKRNLWNGPWLPAAGATTGGIISVFLLLFLLNYLMEDTPYRGNHYIYGSAGHEIYYQDLSTGEVEEIAHQLEYTGHFDQMDYPTIILMEKREDTVKVHFEVAQANWGQEVVKVYYKTLELRMNDLGNPFYLDVGVYDKTKQQLIFNDI